MATSQSTAYQRGRRHEINRIKAQLAVEDGQNFPTTLMMKWGVSLTVEGTAEAPELGFNLNGVLKATMDETGGITPVE